MGHYKVSCLAFLSSRMNPSILSEVEVGPISRAPPEVVQPTPSESASLSEWALVGRLKELGRQARGVTLTCVDQNPH